MSKLIKIGGVTFAFVTFALVAAIGLLAAWMAWRQHQFANQEDTHDLAARADEMGATYLTKRPRAALVIGVFQNGKPWVGGYGKFTTDDKSVTPDGKSIYEIGSITKVFTGITLAQLVEAGTVKLKDPVGRYLEDIGLANDGRGAVTLEQLATHNSGLPRLPANFWKIVDEKSTDPYSTYTTENLLNDFMEVKFNRLPGEGYDYSNYGAALLGQILGIAAKKPYTELVNELVIAPLGLTNTVFKLDDEQAKRLIGGFTIQGEPTPNWNFDSMAPTGALKSTANDLLRFIQLNLNPDGLSIAPALKNAMSVHGNSDTDKMGLGWHRQQTVEKVIVWWHNGGTGGYASFLAIDPQHQTGVVVLSNHGDTMAGRFDVDKIAMNLLRLAAKVSLK